jgi:hypothetical protein
MHKIYEDEGVFNFVYNLPKIIYSTIISSIIDIIIKQLALYETSILDIKKEKKDLNKANKTKTNIIIKLVLFFIISLVFLGIFWFYIGCFCVTYPNTQIYLLKDTLISFSLSLIIPFIKFLLPCFIRIKSLKDSAKCLKCLYNISKILQ